ncbi:uncharacterized protein PRCAT00003106001 [Priceomyces carsonii]|uniref:uncharacterized protein n=1 Tax=Priceomyces carsonii TaxID=28549 RepID=UPI002ED8A39D|nr:unnamed protein product [Priceomyces carsonii]
MRGIKDVRSSISKISICLDQLDSNIEERDRLINLLKLTPSSNDNYDLVTLLGRIRKYLGYLQDDLISLIERGENESSLTAEFKDMVSRFQYLTQKLSNDLTIDILEYEFERKELPKSKDAVKSVRFKDNPEHPEEDLKSELMGSQPFQPYHDDDQNTETESFDNESNQQMFALHAQRLLEQDQSLDSLHDSIQRQHSMGLTINNELDNHLIILNDLEQGVDGSYQRLNTATNRLNDFRRKCKENGSMITIIVLTVILILLLVVLN